MKRTYITVEGKVTEYEYLNYKRKSKRPKCKCGGILATISVQRYREYLKLGYYCALCKNMYMNKELGTILMCKIEEGGSK